ncbi:AAA family ATPase [Campylobacter jejuni]|nr:Replicative helicase [Campylobacter jejuni]EAJ3303759.1 Replicative helicase [Campylobacter jejuni]EAK5501854.1 Replicative helicase [Campylobacter jejuni]ECH5023572.1 AAA family ATPase [Campylobacter jejuni]EIP8467685.1 AAA family ATPase [Campylobacter jejuni]
MKDYSKEINDLKKIKSQAIDKLDFKEFENIESQINETSYNSSKIIPQNTNIKNNSFVDLTQWAIRSVDLEKIEFTSLIDDFLDKGSISFLTSEANKGKTFLSFAICKHLLEFNKIRKIIYFDGDNSKITIKSRIKKSMQIGGYYFLDYPAFNYIQTSNALECGTDEIEVDFNFIVEKYLEPLMQSGGLVDVFIVFDSLFNFFNGDMNDNKKVAEFMKIIKKISHKGEATFLFIHHKGKSAESEFMGGVNFLNATDNLFKIQTSNNDGEILNIELNTKKARNFLPYLKIERAINENDTNFLAKAKEIIEQKGEILQGELLELLEKSKTDTHAIKKLESGKGLYFNIIEKSRATGGKALKYYVPLKENKTIINGIEINAEQTLFSE